MKGEKGQVELGIKEGEVKIEGFKGLTVHTWGWDDLQKRFPNSGLNQKEPDKSKGLSEEEVKNLQLKYGLNRLTPQKEVSKIVLFLRQFLDGLMILLQIAGILSLIAYGIDTSVELNLILGLVLFGIVVFQCIVSFLQELETHKLMNSFKNLIPPDCQVMRNGEFQNASVVNLVPGDIVKVQYGQKIPADIRVIHVQNFKVECASITGESLPVKCTTEAEKPEVQANNSTNLAYSSTSCVEGIGIGIVFQTGDTTIIGQIAKTINSTPHQITNLEKDLLSFVHFVGKISISVAAVFFIIGVLNLKEKSSANVLNVFINGFLVVIIAFVPQGLPATVVSLLTIVGKRLAVLHIFVKRLNVIETLGSISLIASDKTGTLTKNQMSVQDIWCENSYQSITEHQPFETILKAETGLTKLLRITAICNQSKIILTAQVGKNPFRDSQSKQNLSKYSKSFRQSSMFGGQKAAQNSVVVRQQMAQDLKIQGNASDIALLRFVEGYTSSSRLRKNLPPRFEIPFSSTTKWQLCIVKDPSVVAVAGQPEKYVCLIKGAPERIFDLCESYYDVDSKEAPINAQFKRRFEQAYKKFASQGKRVIGFCEKTFYAPTNVVFNQEEKNFPMEKMVFIGITGIIDPPRDDVPAAISICKSAGIRVFMVTGDHPDTAEAISRQIGIIDEQEEEDELEQQKRRLQNQDSIELTINEGMVAKPKSKLSPFIEKYSQKNYAVVTGMQMEKLSEFDWEELYKKQGIVFARVTPNDKLDIVKRMQSQGVVVAATGDGVNDAQALKQANVGIAMGIQGSEVAKDAADIILMDDNFASIVRGIEQGRLIFDNLKKTIAFTLAHTLPEVIPVLLSLAFGLPQGLSSLQILSIDLFSDLCPAVSLAYETPESDIMERPPRDLKNSKLTSSSLIFYSYAIAGGCILCACVASYAFVFQSYGIPMSFLNFSDKTYFTDGAPDIVTSDGDVYNDHKQKEILWEVCASFHLTIGISQFFHFWNSRTLSVSIFQHGVENTVAFFGATLEICLIIIFVYIPGVQDVLLARNAKWIPWVVSVINGIIITIYNEGRKYYFQKKIENDEPPNWTEKYLQW